MAKQLQRGGLKHVSGGPGRRPMVWRVTAPGLSRTYTFTPGVATYVDPEDLAWFQDPDNLGGRVFEVVATEVPLAPVAHTPPPQTRSGGGGNAGDAGKSAASTSTNDAGKSDGKD